MNCLCMVMEQNTKDPLVILQLERLSGVRRLAEDCLARCNSARIKLCPSFLVSAREAVAVGAKPTRLLLNGAKD